MKLSLFRIVPTAPARSKVRFFEAAVIAANNLQDALHTHPASTSGVPIMWDEGHQHWLMHFKDGTFRRYINMTWPGHPRDLEWVKIGDGFDDLEPGVVLASRNAV